MPCAEPQKGLTPKDLELAKYYAQQWKETGTRTKEAADWVERVANTYSPEAIKHARVQLWGDEK